MTNAPFNELLKSPHLLASMPIEELENITKNYPWFSLAHSYLAKAYQENKSHKTSGQIALASTLHSNRTWLYGFLKEPILQKQTPTELNDTLPTEIITAIVVEDSPRAATPSTSLVQLAASMMDEEVRPEVREGKRGEEEVRQEVREVKREEEQEAREVKREEEQEVREVKRGEEKGRQDEVTDLDFLDKSILATAVSSSIFLEVSELDEEQDSAKDVSQGALQDSSKDVSQGALQDSSKDVSQGASQGLEEEEESNALFTWLRSVSDADDKDEVKEELREDKRWEEEGRKSTDYVQPSKDLIEKFIATEPRITPGKVEQYTGVSFAKESLEENFDWVTETMAKLYATQGKTDRARKAYKRLIELHPEKKVHFENQLKALNQRK
jgi:tetratricopeptide (TPR) repeat protein